MKQTQFPHLNQFSQIKAHYSPFCSFLIPIFFIGKFALLGSNEGEPYLLTTSLVSAAFTETISVSASSSVTFSAISSATVSAATSATAS